MTKDYICIACPMGCPMVLDDSDALEMKVSGNKCMRGRSYAIEEHSDPKRVVSTTVQSDSSVYPRIPVKTDRAIQKQHIDGLLEHLYSLRVRLPVKCGDVIVSNFHDTGVQVVVTRSLDPGGSAA